MTVANLVAQLVSLPMGRALAYVLPDVEIFGLPLNPGPFTVKEHVLVTVMASVGYSSAYATDIIAVQRVFYKQNWNFSCLSSLACMMMKGDDANPFLQINGCSSCPPNSLAFRWVVLPVGSWCRLLV